MKIGIISLIIITLTAQVVYAKENISDKIENLIKETDPNLNIGIKITNLDQGKIIFEKNADRYFIPASTLKFISLLTTLEYFGEDYNFTSDLLHKDQDYYLNIHDPDFKPDDLANLVSELAKQAGKNIKGNIYIVNNQFSLPQIMRDKTFSDSVYCYGAPITLTHVNKNCSKLDVEPGNIGGSIKIIADKNFPYNIINEAKTIAENENDRLNVTIEDGKYLIKGTLSKSTGAVTIAAVANDNLSQVKYYLKKQLDNNGIVLKGKILFIDNKPHGAKLVASVSKNAKDIAAQAMKKSDNFMTDYLLAEFAYKQGLTEWDWAASKLKDVLASKFNVDLAKSDLRDASGISRQNLLTVNQFDSFLKAVAKRYNFELVKSILDRPNDDSTLNGRFENFDIYAKTGSLTGISALVGYFYDTKKELYSFVIMTNNFYQNRFAYRQLEEDILKLVSSNF
jgi:D-alanyl-D-alanine carboxypeptidase/D-alanyl-D-alanine-endopeptidase (penicillin-binding protein 4)